MKKKLTRFMAFMLILSMLITLMPVVSVKAADEELPTIEELCAKVDPVIGSYATAMSYPTSWAVTRGECQTLTSYLRRSNDTFTVEKISDGYRLVHDSDTSKYIDLYFENGIFTGILHHEGKGPYDNRLYYWPKEKNYQIPLCVCTEHPNVKHTYIGDIGEETYTFCVYFDGKPGYELLMLDINIDDIEYGIERMFGDEDVKAYQMYYRDKESGHLKPCNNKHLDNQHIVKNNAEIP